MHTPLFVFLSLSLSFPFLSQAKEAPNPVVDINGTMVRGGVKYYVLALDPDEAGLGFNLLSVGSENRCPKSVFEAEPYWWGCLIAFHPVNPEKGVIREWTDLNIEIFYDEYTTPCPEPNFWKVHGDPSRYDITHYITTGGEKGNPGQQTVSSWFKILRTENAYKFMYCPSFCCDSCRVVCQDVGISERGAEGSPLALSDTPIQFVFRRPETLETLKNIGTPVKLDAPHDITSCNCDLIRNQKIS